MIYNHNTNTYTVETANRSVGDNISRFQPRVGLETKVVWSKWGKCIKIFVGYTALNSVNFGKRRSEIFGFNTCLIDNEV